MGGDSKYGAHVRIFQIFITLKSDLIIVPNTAHILQLGTSFNKLKECSDDCNNRSCTEGCLKEKNFYALLKTFSFSEAPINIVIGSPCLIDSDYSYDWIAYLRNFGAHSYTLKQYSKIKLVFMLNFHSHIYPNYNLGVFFQYKESRFYGYDVLKNLHVGSFGANGIDLVFEGDYEIQGKGTLTLKLPFNEKTPLSLKNSIIIIPRSKFTRLGLGVVQYGCFYNPLTLVNNSIHPIFLGKRFIQMIIPSPFCFELNSEMLNTILPGAPNSIQHSLNRKQKPQENIIFSLDSFGFLD